MRNEITPSEIKKIIASENITQLKINLKLENDQDIFKLLLEYLEKILKKFNVSYKSVTYKILGFLEELAIKEDNNLMDKCSIITEEREKVIQLIKLVSKKDRQTSKKIIFLKDLANRLENLELNIIYNLKSPLILANYNIVKYIIFKLKDINYSKDLINKNTYLINAFNINSENIFNLIIEEYLKAIEKHAKEDESFNLFYYDEVLEQLLNNDKIKKDSEIIEKCIKKAINFDKQKNLTGKQQKKYICWFKHLIKKLDNPKYEDDFEAINNMYTVNFFYKKSILEEGHTLGRKNQKTEANSLEKDYIITIDDSTTCDRDDALSIEKINNELYNLKIFIADPNTFCGKKSLLMKEARKRTETLYLEDQMIGMFPEEIVKAYLSLDENKNRLVREYSYKINTSGIIEDFKIKKKIIQVDRNYTYEEANVLITKCYDEKTEKTIENLLELRNLLTKRHINDTVLAEDITTSERLIETYMIFNNNKIAEFFSSKGIPFVYRHHNLKRVMDDCGINLNSLPHNNRKRYAEIIKNMEKINLSAIYSCQKKNHEGLDLSHYCHSTSPIRRYADILVNECEDKFYFSRMSDKEIDKFEKYLTKEVEHLNDKAKGTAKYYEKYQKAKIRSLKTKEKSLQKK